MKDRLQQFLDIKNISAARLADMMGIQRSALSHILGGRNKPSYDFIAKFITLFPYVSAEWFITGKGEAFKNMASPVNLASQSKAVPQISGKPDTEANVSTNASGIQNDIRENDDDFPIVVEKKSENEDPVQKEASKNGIPQKIASVQNNSERSISRIIILFSDGTYQEMK